MCTVIIYRNSSAPWPVLIAANRDEMVDRPSKPPGRWWDDRPEVMAGQDELAGGAWLGLNDHGLVAAILNRKGTLGPAPGKRSRGELPLDALDFADAADAQDALSQLAPEAYRPFNMVIADNQDAYWLSNTGQNISAAPIPEGFSMITHADLNDESDPRIALYRPRFEASDLPDPEAGDWADWIDLLGAGDTSVGEGPESALCFLTERQFGTVSSSLLALPSADLQGVKPRFLFADGPPNQAPFQAVGESL